MRTHPVDKLLVQHCCKSAAGLLQLVRFYVCTISFKCLKTSSTKIFHFNYTMSSPRPPIQCCLPFPVKFDAFWYVLVYKLRMQHWLVMGEGEGSDIVRNKLYRLTYNLKPHVSRQLLKVIVAINKESVVTCTWTVQAEMVNMHQIVICKPNFSIMRGDFTNENLRNIMQVFCKNYVRKSITFKKASFNFHFNNTIPYLSSLEFRS